MVDSEQPLLGFGPLGVSVSEGPFGVFRWHWRNVFRIELTAFCLRGIRKFRFMSFKHPRGGAPFEIPYAALISAKLLPYPSPISMMRILTIAYRDGEDTRETSIAAYTSKVEQAFAILEHYAPGRCTRDLR